MDKVLVVIPAYNAEHYIGETIRSVLKSSHQNITVAVINDGSSDGTEKEVKKIDDSRVIVVTRSNAGMSASRNYGIDMFDTEFIALVDSDDIWHPKKIELQIEVMKRDPQVDFCYTEFIKFWDGDTVCFEKSQVSAELDQNLSGFIYHKMLLTNWALPSSVVFRRSLWNDLGPFLCNDQQTDDWEYFVRASRFHQFAKLKSPLVLYRQPQQSLSRRITKRNSTEEMRSSLIQRFGLVSPQGNHVDTVELDKRIYNGLVDFYDIQLSRGNFRQGMAGFCELFFCRQRKLKTTFKFIKSLRMRIFR